MNLLKLTIILISIVFDPFSKSEKENILFKNGIYIASSQAGYTYEPYVGKVIIEVDNNKIVKAEFQIIDTLQNEIFGPDYDKHFPNNALYQEQCHNDWKGVQYYPKELIKKQNIDSVDVVSGATWSYNIFKASVEKALNK